MSSNPASPHGSKHKNTPKKRITKDQKICQLKSELKVSREENARLRKELERLTQGTSGSSPNQPTQTVNEEQQKKFRDAMRAVKKVTVQQEICIKTLRNKASQRRKDMKRQDDKIKTLQLKVMSLENANKVTQGDADLHEKIKELQMAYDEIRHRKDELEELLDEKESQLESLNNQRHPQLTPLQKRSNRDLPSDGESVGSGSLQSASTNGDFDVARLKTELAKKSEKILALQMDLDSVKDELYDLKQRKTTDPFTTLDPFGSNTADPFPAMRQQLGDEWTDAEETDAESELGEMQFGECFFKETGEDNIDFW